MPTHHLQFNEFPLEAMRVEQVWQESNLDHESAAAKQDLWIVRGNWPTIKLICCFASLGSCLPWSQGHGVFGGAFLTGASLLRWTVGVVGRWDQSDSFALGSQPNIFADRLLELY